MILDGLFMRNSIVLERNTLPTRFNLTTTIIMMNYLYHGLLILRSRPLGGG